MSNNIKYFRNTKDVLSHQGIKIDNGSLWKQENNKKLVLEDDDQYITIDYSENNFEKAI